MRFGAMQLPTLFHSGPRTLFKSHTFFSGYAKHRVGKKAPSCQQCFLVPGMFAALGTGRLWGARATICWSRCAWARHQPSLQQDPGPSFWQLPGPGEPRPGLDDLTAVRSAPQRPVFLSLSGAHPGCWAEGPLSFSTRGSHCLACASTWQSKRLSTKRPGVSSVRGCLLVPPEAWTPSRGGTLPAFPFLFDRSGNSVKDI